MTSSHTKSWAFAGLLVALYLYCFPYFQKIHSANELPRIYLTMAIADEGSFAIDTGVARWGKTVDVSPHNGSLYSNKAPGSSLLAVPAYVVLKFVKAIVGGEPSLSEITWVCRVFAGVVPSLLFLLLLWRFLAAFAPARATRRLVVGAYGLGSMAMTYSILFISHQLAAICISTGYFLSVWVIEKGRSLRWMWVAGLAAGAAPLVDYQAAFAGIPLAVYICSKFLMSVQRQWRGVLYAIGGASVPISFLLFYHSRAFGGVFRTGYSASESFAHFHQRGFLGLDQFRSEALIGSTFLPSNGLFVLCPILLLAIPGWFLMARRKQWWHFGITLSVAGIYIGFISCLIFWRGGWQLGPRYIVAMLPFLFVPVSVAAAWSESRWPARSTVVGLAGVGIVIYATSSAIFPHYPEVFANPFYELVLRLASEGHVAYSAGWLLGLRGLASVFPYFLLLMMTAAWLACPTRHHWKSALCGAATCLAIVAAYSQCAGGGPSADAAYQRIVNVMPK